MRYKWKTHSDFPDYVSKVAWNTALHSCPQRRINNFTCFLEYHGDIVEVYDLLHQKMETDVLKVVLSEVTY